MAERTIARAECPHLAAGHRSATSTLTACEECGLSENLRICLTCGHVGCCESQAAHDTAHFHQTGHPLIKPYRDVDVRRSQIGHDWLWCYACNDFLE